MSQYSINFQKINRALSMSCLNSVQLSLLGGGFRTFKGLPKKVVLIMDFPENLQASFFHEIPFAEILFPSFCLLSLV